MEKARIVFIVGHRHWGKSTTLTALANGMRRYISLSGVEFFIRRMSNDDRPDEFFAKMDGLNAVKTPSLIVAFCPTMKEDSRARRCLNSLRRKGYRLFFWVLRRQQKPGSNGFIEPGEIRSLQRYGRVKVFEGQAPKSSRAKSLRGFISDRVLGHH
jgi:hypothetical protein